MPLRRSHPASISPYLERTDNRSGEGMNTKWIALATVSMLAGPASAQRSEPTRPAQPWWSITSGGNAGTRLPGFGIAAAWRLSAQDNVTNSTLLFGASAQATDPLMRSRQLAIGYAYRLSEHTTLVTDAARSKATMSSGDQADYRIRSISIGLRGAY